MADDPTTRPRRGTALTAVGLLLGWVAVVVIGAGRRPEDPARLGVDNLGVVFFAILVLLALAGLLIMILFKPTSTRGFTPPERSRRSIWLLLGLFILFNFWRPDVISALQDLAGDPQEETPTEETAEVELPEAQPAAPSVAQATDIFFILTVVGVIAGVWAYTRRATDDESHFDDTPEAVGQLEAELISAMDDAVGELSDHGDPRSSVLNAYATLEHVLTSHGLHRTPAETPAEHLRRALAGLSVDPDPLVELGQLYEIARFSHDDITVLQQVAARSALERARTQLAGVP